MQQLSDASKEVPWRLDYLFNHSVTLEGKLVIICKVGELLLRHLYPTWTGNVVYTALVEKLIEGITLIVEACGFNLPTII